MSQITLFLGPNSYAIQQERSRWVQEFKKRQGEDSLFLCDAKTTSFKDLHNECQMAPFLAEKRLIVIDGVPSRGTKEDVETLVHLVHPQALLLFTLETEVGKNPKLTIPAKALCEVAKVVDFPLLSAVQLQQWAEQLVRTSGAAGIQSDAMKALLQTVGDDQSLLASEIQKLGMYAFEREITSTDVSLLATSSAERDVWQLMDYLGAGNPKKTLQFIHDLLDRGYSPQALWGTFVWMVTILTHIVAVVESGESNPWKIAGTVRANPAGVKAILPFARSISRDALRQIIDVTVDADMGLKTGAYKATSEAPEEILALIDRSVLTFSR